MSRAGMFWGWGFRWGLPVVLLVGGLPVAPVSAQRPPARAVSTSTADRSSGGAFAAVEADAREGRLAEARARLLRWFDESAPEAGGDDLQQALWLRALLTLDPLQAADDYRRLAVEFAGGAWADRALERLAWIAEVSGDRLGAARRYEAITRDYPLSELAARARTWLKEHAPEVAELQAAEAAAASSAAGTVGGTVGGIRAGVGAETGNGAGTGDKRAAARSAAAPPSAGRPASTGAASAGRGGEAGPARPPAAVRTAADPAPERRPAPVSGARPDPTPAAPAPATAVPAAAPAAAIGSFTVQLGAFLNPARAMAVADRASRADHVARRVRMPDDQLVRVRVGRFVRRAEAEALVAALQAAGFEARVADDATRELPYR